MRRGTSFSQRFVCFASSSSCATRLISHHVASPTPIPRTSAAPSFIKPVGLMCGAWASAATAIVVRITSTARIAPRMRAFSRVSPSRR